MPKTNLKFVSAPESPSLKGQVSHEVASKMLGERYNELKGKRKGMGRSKKKKNLRKAKFEEEAEEESVDKNVPIPNLPKDFLWMRVNSGTKIRNVLGYALKEFSNHECIVWTGIGQGVGKAISCAELFKTKHEGLHQITKLRYVISKKSKEETDDAKEKARRVPEIHILLSKEIKNVTEPGYQAPDDPGRFSLREDSTQTKSGFRSNVNKSGGGGGGSNMTSVDAEKFAAMGLRTGQKRPKRGQQMDIDRFKDVYTMSKNYLIALHVTKLHVITRNKVYKRYWKENPIRFLLSKRAGNTSSDMDA
ncbi:hypothetical protein KPH14_011553 [Odynerus spinipes]|uniref:DNA/RNA-binding protein Alba-like domain-containing protein n=1 Tax=Odynerus spinipes TaxID=1348599 RepID=A0AAD9RHZ6_9HYME|nr:hypothetical protein KPH14_011553 [Odynerus spinipes]